MTKFVGEAAMMKLWELMKSWVTKKLTDDIDGVLSAATTMNGNDLWNEGNNLAMGGIVEWAGTQSASVTVKNSSTSSVAGVYLYNGKLIAKGTDGNWYGNWQDSGRWGDTAEDGGWQPSKNVVYRLSGSNTLWRWSGTAMERMFIAADSATALSSSAGSSTQPVYFSGGKPVACTMQTTMNALCNALGAGDSAPQDNDYYICQYAGGGTSDTRYFRRPTSLLYAYMKGKMDALYPTKTGSGASGTWGINISGNAQSAAKALYFNYGNAINQNTNNYKFHRILTCPVITARYVDRTGVFMITTDFNGGGYGIFRVSLRTNNVNNGESASLELHWLFRYNFDVGDIQAGFNNTSGSSFADVFYVCKGSYQSAIITRLHCGARGSIQTTWNFINSEEVYGTTTTDKKTSKEVYASLAEASSELGVEYTHQITSAISVGIVYSANRLSTARTINGTSFDGSGNITTAKWGTARAVKIGNTSKNVDGSAALTWTLAEIGAAASDHNHDSSYAAKSHNHDSSYAAKSHTHSIGNVSGLQTSLDGKLNKTTYEVNTELQMGSSGKVCLGKYTCGDSNITIEIASTAASTYHGTLVIATQNITSSGSGTYTAKVYGDADSALTPLIKIQRSGAVFAVYADLPTYSKNLIHARCSNPAAAPTDIATQVSAIPSAATIKPDNALGRFATASSVSSISSTVSGHTTQLSDLNLRTVHHSDKSIVCTTATAPDAQGRLVGKTGFYAGQAVYMGVQATYVFFAATGTTGTLVVYGQGVGTKGGGTMANQIMYSRTAANAWAKLG